MKSARLIKRQELMRPGTGKPSQPENHSASVISDVEAVRNWIRKHRQQRPLNLRAEFAAMFSQVI